MSDVAKVILFIMLVFMIFLEITGQTHLKDSSLVISFFGILATFVVIGNYSQVKDIKQDTHDEIRKIKQEITDKFNNLYKQVLDEDNVHSIVSQHKQILTDLYDERGNSKLTPLTNALQKHASENALLRKLVKIQNNRNEALRLILSSLLHSETRNHISLIENIYELGSYKCKVKCDNQPESIDAIAKWSDKEGIIFFVCTTSSRIDHVFHVSNKKINKQEIDNILRGLKLLLKSD